MERLYDPKRNYVEQLMNTYTTPQEERPMLEWAIYCDDHNGDHPGLTVKGDGNRGQLSAEWELEFCRKECSSARVLYREVGEWKVNEVHDASWVIYVDEETYFKMLEH